MSGLDRLERLEQEATPGPWEQDTRSIFTLYQDSTYRDVAIDIDDADAALIVALRNLAPELIQVAKAAEDCLGFVDHMVKGDALANALAALERKLAEEP